MTFSRVEVEEHAPSSQDTLEGVFESSCWTIAREVHKRSAFQKPSSLCVLWLTSRIGQEDLFVSNKRERMEEVPKEADAVSTAGVVLRRAPHRRDEGFSLLISSFLLGVPEQWPRVLGPGGQMVRQALLSLTACSRRHPWVSQSLVTSMSRLIAFGASRLQ
jgi:hypothetical protein